MDLLLLVLGLIGLWIGTEVSVRGAIRITEYLGWSPLFVGMTLLAFGTDLPELVVAIRGSINNLQGIESSGFIVGNAIGSCVAQIGIVAGIIGIFSTIPLGKNKLPQLSMQLGGSILIMYVAILGGSVNRLEGLAMLLFFGLYLFLLFDQQSSTKAAEKKINVWIQFLIVATGMGLVIFSADMVLSKALVISDRFAVRQSLVGAIVVGLGTSLPELGISLNAALKKKPGLSLGNLVGSNIFDCLVPIGCAAVIAPLNVESPLIWFDTPFLAILTTTFLLLLFTRKELVLREGIVLVVFYLVYVGGSLVLR